MKKVLKFRPHIVTCLISIALLIGAVVERHEYGYYQVLRWVVCGSAGFVAYLGMVRESPWILWPYLAAAILFNPLFPFHFHRSTWQTIDWIMIGILMAALIFVRLRPENYPSSQEEPRNYDLTESASEYLERQAADAERRLMEKYRDR